MTKLILIGWVLVIQSCSIFGNISPKLLEDVKIDDNRIKDKKIFIYSSKGNATLNESIQLNFANISGKEYHFYYENYDLYKGCYYDKGTLYLYVTDTNAVNITIDTIRISLDNVLAQQ
jgi:hypothetical protein